MPSVKRQVVDLTSLFSLLDVIAFSCDSVAYETGEENYRR